MLHLFGLFFTVFYARIFLLMLTFLLLLQLCQEGLCSVFANFMIFHIISCPAVRMVGALKSIPVILLFSPRVSVNLTTKAVMNLKLFENAAPLRLLGELNHCM